jgi:2-isopropylmalate synthase
LRDLSIFVDEVANQRSNPRAPFVGTTAFAHKGGMHANAVNKLSASYEHIEPAQVGNEQRILVGELAGRSNVAVKARQLGLELDEKHPAARQALEEIKRLEGQGYEFEAADASFELLMKKVLNKYQPFFELVKYYVSIRKDTRDTCEATLKLLVGENKSLATAVEEGDGPVNALDKALRTALLPHCPKLSLLHLVDYKVRIVDSTAGTGACTRVLIESSNGETNWTTVGVSTDIIEASWLALRDSVDYFFSKLGDGRA